MEEFTLQGKNSFLKISFKEVFGFPKITSPFGGYDTKSIVEVESGNFNVRSIINITTGDIFSLYKNLSEANDVLKGSVHFENYERNLEVDLVYDNTGHISVTGSFPGLNEFRNMFKFDFRSDQTYIQSTLRQLQLIAEKYGDMKGVKSN